jgi:hypothetical protein
LSNGALRKHKNGDTAGGSAAEGTLQAKIDDQIRAEAGGPSWIAERALSPPPQEMEATRPRILCGVVTDFCEETATAAGEVGG